MLNAQRLVKILSSTRLQKFIEEHINADTHQLAFSEINLTKEEKSLAFEQINLLQKIKKKCPKAFRNKYILTKKGVEQCSSEKMAAYKAELFSPFNTVLDLSFGTGIDSFAFGNKAVKVDAVEQDDKRFCFGLANLKKINSNSISLSQGDGIEYLKESSKFYDLIYSDPDRRDDDGKRKKGWMDLNPSVQETLRFAQGKCSSLIIKLSPLLESSDFLRLNPSCSELHYISLNNEMKEVLAVFHQNKKHENRSTQIIINEVNYRKKSFTFNFSEITRLSSFSDEANYIYQLWPGFSASRTLGLVVRQLGIDLLGNSRTLCCSKKMVEVPGRSYRVLRQCSFKALKSVLKEMEINEAAIHSRSLALRSEEVRKKLKLRESDLYELFLVKDAQNKSQAFITVRIK